MLITNQQKSQIQEVITNSLRKKFQNYNLEPASLPFYFRLHGKDRIAPHSFIHSLSTNFGTSIFESVAKSLALLNFADTQLQQWQAHKFRQRCDRLSRYHG
ncbi:MAG: TdeIII family type II restriction endonuclease [Campylobacteraceae bacterium]|jgi:type II restriction enzyme|nr:TdeIII family type II restriction endonuclease [Campylobacteraceae bacterium]